MLRFIAKRLLLALPTLWAVLTLVFLLVRVVPGDPTIIVLGDQASRPDPGLEGGPACERHPLGHIPTRRQSDLNDHRIHPARDRHHLVLSQPPTTVEEIRQTIGQSLGIHPGNGRPRRTAATPPDVPPSSAT